MERLFQARIIVAFKKVSETIRNETIRPVNLGFLSTKRKTNEQPPQSKPKRQKNEPDLFAGWSHSIARLCQSENNCYLIS